MKTMLENAVVGILPTDEEALALADYTDTRALADAASQIRDQGFNNVVTYSRKVFIPLTHLCRDVCHYCTFAQVPRKVQAPYLSIDEVLELARHGHVWAAKKRSLPWVKNRNYVTRLHAMRWLKWATPAPQTTYSPQLRRSLKKPAYCRI